MLEDDTRSCPGSRAGIHVTVVFGADASNILQKFMSQSIKCREDLAVLFTHARAPLPDLAFATGVGEHHQFSDKSHVLYMVSIFTISQLLRFRGLPTNVLLNCCQCVANVLLTCC